LLWLLRSLNTNSVDIFYFYQESILSFLTLLFEITQRF
jgi:hypothetical protein